MGACLFGKRWKEQTKVSRRSIDWSGVTSEYGRWPILFDRSGGPLEDGGSKRGDSDVCDH
jgi:hypothetical protein